mmetsp:Transcript_34255/g.80245  ORF Transcript_34255/g.80245 Transcript_34255/m.80245 type:complete len:226 (-) Transcript_34255:163-840(-)
MRLPDCTYCAMASPSPGSSAPPQVLSTFPSTRAIGCGPTSSASSRLTERFSTHTHLYFLGLGARGASEASAVEELGPAAATASPAASASSASGNAVHASTPSSFPSARSPSSSRGFSSVRALLFLSCLSSRCSLRASFLCLLAAFRDRLRRFRSLSESDSDSDSEYESDSDPDSDLLSLARARRFLCGEDDLDREREGDDAHTFRFGFDSRAFLRSSIRASIRAR